MPEAIEKFLPEVYTQTAKPDRYTYAQGSTAASSNEAVYEFVGWYSDAACTEANKLSEDTHYTPISLFGGGLVTRMAILGVWNPEQDDLKTAATALTLR